MSDINMIAFDLDGTLLENWRQVDAVLIEVLQNIKRRYDVRFIAASARPPRSIDAVLQDDLFDDLRVAYNGSVVYRVSTREVLQAHHIPNTIAQQSYRLIKEMLPASNCTLESDDRWYIEDYNPDIKNFIEENDFQPPGEQPLCEDLLCRLPVTTLFFMSDDTERCLLIQQSLQTLYASEIHTMLQRGSMQYRSHFFRLSSNVNKLTGIAAVAQRYGIPLTQVMAIGDGLNDREMIEGAGVGVLIDSEAGLSEIKAHIRLARREELAAFLTGYFTAAISG